MLIVIKMHIIVVTDFTELLQSCRQCDCVEEQLYRGEQIKVKKVSCVGFGLHFAYIKLRGLNFGTASQFRILTHQTGGQKILHQMVARIPRFLICCELLRAYNVD
jgi:hypothetical protein